MSFKNTKRFPKGISPLVERNITPEVPSKCIKISNIDTNIDTTGG